MPITAKYNVEGDFTKVKPRIVVADTKTKCQMANVYAPAVQMDAVRRQVNLEVQMRAHSVTADASDADHQGTPPDPMSENGRFIFVRPLVVSSTWAWIAACTGKSQATCPAFRTRVWRRVITSAAGYSARGTRRAWSIVASIIGATKTMRSRSSAFM